MDTLDSKGLFGGAHNAGKHTPVFKNWLEEGRTLAQLGPNKFRYSRILDGKNVSIVYTNGKANFRPYAHKADPNDIFIKVKPNRVKSNALRRADQTAATQILAQRIANGSVDVNQFTKAEKIAITAGDPKVGNYTWHHGDTPGHMQLVQTAVHNKFSHFGWFKFW